MRKIGFILVLMILVIVGADEYYHRQLIDFPGFPSQSTRVVRQKLPRLKAPRDASRETRQVVRKRPVHYRGYFDAKNKAAYLAQIQRFALRDINTERAKRHLPALKLDRHLNQVAAMRSVQADRNFNHYNRAGQVLACLDAVKTRWQPSYLVARGHLSECLSEQAGDIDNTAPQVARTAVKGMIYHDATSHWGHRKILLDRGNRDIGIVAHVNKSKDNKVVVAYELYQ